ncbi:esterase/lipase family protein [Tsukamurella pseudospumae]|uniref:esterase/lipase family protein n=1 Tax=Tsukamurella pseudospumae TaxID=239498 RepID=UPI000B2E2780|nr:hypothetical protein [Tsukamurella pseudospumae]
MNCPKPLGKDGPEPVLLIPGTASTPESAFGWNLMKAFREEGTPFCSVTLPDEANADIQRSAEYVVHALRKMNSSSGKKVQIVGWSQGGGPLPRWALKFWPDTRHMVDNLIGIDPDNHGSAVVNLLGCGVINTFCSPALWQQRPDSHFISTLNRGGMTYPEVNYTVLYLNFSNVVEPSVHGESQSLPPGPNVTNVSLQGTLRRPALAPLRSRDRRRAADHGEPDTGDTVQPGAAAAEGIDQRECMYEDLAGHPGEHRDHREQLPAAIHPVHSSPFGSGRTCTPRIRSHYPLILAPVRIAAEA